MELLNGEIKLKRNYLKMTAQVGQDMQWGITMLDKI